MLLSSIGLPGEQSGNSLADILFGDVNPSGRLPYTIAKQLSDYPASISNESVVSGIKECPLMVHTHQYLLIPTLPHTHSFFYRVCVLDLLDRKAFDWFQVVRCQEC
jgi:hypothetical protein